MEFLKGAVVAAKLGCLVSVVVSMVVMVTLAVLSDGAIDIAFFIGLIGLPIIIGVWVVPISIVLGLVYVIIHRAVRVVKGGNVAPGPSTPSVEG